MDLTFHTRHIASVVAGPADTVASGGGTLNSRNTVDAHKLGRKLTYLVSADLTGVIEATPFLVVIGTSIDGGSNFTDTLRDADGDEIVFDVAETFAAGALDSDGVMVATINIDGAKDPTGAAIDAYRLEFQNDDAGDTVEVMAMAVISDLFDLPAVQTAVDQAYGPLLRPTI
jgi:hypothetical protein